MKRDPSAGSDQVSTQAAEVRAGSKVRAHPPLRFEADSVLSELFNDRYKSRAGAFEEADEVFVAACALTTGWADAEQFTVLEVGFGLGVSFLASLRHWLDDPRRCARLHFVSIEQYPVSARDLAAGLRHLGAPPDLAQALVAQWPAAIEGPHRLRFAEGRVTLQLVLGDARRWLPRLALVADAIHLDGFAPARNPEAWEAGICLALGRLARTGARLSSYTASAEVRRRLTAAGFDMSRRPGFGGKRERLEGVRAPRRAEPGTPARPPTPRPEATRGRRAIVVGAGLAGCAITATLLERGWRVTLIEAAGEAMPAGSASAQPLCAEHLHLAPDDNPLARLSRAAWLLARPQADRHELGRLLLAPDQTRLDARRTLLERLDWPTEVLAPVDAVEADRLAGAPVGHPALWWPGCAVVDPRQRAHALLTDRPPALDWRPGVSVATINWIAPPIRGRGDGGDSEGKSEGRSEGSGGADEGEVGAGVGGRWQVHDADGRCQAEAPILILANAGAAPHLAGMHSLTLQRRPGRSLALDAPPLADLRCVLSTRGYVLPMGDGRVLIDPTRPPEGVGGLDDAMIAAADSATAGPAEGATVGSAAGHTARSAPGSDTGSRPGPAPMASRFATPDHLPVIGVVPDEALITADPRPWQRNDRLPLPVRPGLYLACAFGGRGLLWSTLAAEVLAAHLEGEPAPIDQTLLDAIAPARFLRRALRRSLPLATGPLPPAALFPPAPGV